MSTKEGRPYHNSMGDTPTAKRFYSILLRCGFNPTERPIRIAQPVADRNGIVRKTVHVPDFYVDSEFGSMYFEVTQGSGNTASKKAQQRVVEAAEITNYFVVGGDLIRYLETVPEEYLPDVVAELLFPLANPTEPSETE